MWKTLRNITANRNATHKRSHIQLPNLPINAAAPPKKNLSIDSPNERHTQLSGKTPLQLFNLVDIPAVRLNWQPSNQGGTMKKKHRRGTQHALKILNVFANVCIRFFDITHTDIDAEKREFRP